MALFIISGKGFVSLELFLKSYLKNFAIIVCFLLLLFGVYQNIQHTNQIIHARETSYIAVRDAGLWIRENSAPLESVVSSSIVQNYYYSERVTYNMGPNMADFSKSCLDNSGSIMTTRQCQIAWEKAFNDKVLKFKPSYFIVSVYEPGFTPQWSYDYPQRNNLAVIKAFFQPEDLSKPTLIIYKFPNNFIPANPQA